MPYSSGLLGGVPNAVETVAVSDRWQDGCQHGRDGVRAVGSYQTGWIVRVCVCVLVRLEDSLCLPGRVDGARAGCGAAVPSVGLPDLGIPTQPSPAAPLTSTPAIPGYSAPRGHN